MIKRELSGLTLNTTTRQQSVESKRKLKLRHESWTKEQKVLQEKVKESHLRRQKQEFSEYDWNYERASLEGEGNDILSSWTKNRGRRNERVKDVVKRLNTKKYSKQFLPRCCPSRG